MLNPREGLSSVELFEFYYWLNRRLLRFSGIDALKENVGNRVWGTRALFGSSLAAMCFIFLPQVYELINQPITTVKTMEIVGINLIIFNSSCKIVILLYHQDMVGRQEETWRGIWKETVSPEEISHLCDYTKKAKALGISYLICGCALVIAYVVAPVLVGWSDNFVNGISLPFFIGVKLESNITLACFYAGQTVAACMCCMIIIGVDLIAPTFILHACGHFQVLRLKLHNIEKHLLMSETFPSTDNRDEIISDKQSVRIVHDPQVAFSVNKCIQRHQTILNACADIERSFNLVGLIEAVCAIYQICLAGIGVLVIPEERIKFCVHIMAAQYQLLTFCWPSTVLMGESMEIADTVFHLPWYHCSRMIQKNVLIMIMRAQKSCRYTAGKYFVLSLESYTALISNGLSAFAVLMRFM